MKQHKLKKTRHLPGIIQVALNEIKAQWHMKSEDTMTKGNPANILDNETIFPAKKKENSRHHPEGRGTGARGQKFWEDVLPKNRDFFKDFIFEAHTIFYIRSFLKKRDRNPRRNQNFRVGGFDATESVPTSQNLVTTPLDMND